MPTVTRRYSKKRQAILDAIRSTDSHPGAEWIYSRLKSDYPSLSLATVYRNLRSFADEGEISCVGTVQGSERYDRNTKPHAHLVCEACGAVIDLEGIDVSADYAEAERESGGRVHTHSLTFTGLCGNCVSKGERIPSGNI